MKLPVGTKTDVEREKISDYLLNPAHPENGGKAAFFEGMGFRQSEWETFAEALRSMATHGDVVRTTDSPHGRKYVIIGKLESPSGRVAMAQTIWIVDKGEQAARLVTAYPAKARETK